MSILGGELRPALPSGFDQVIDKAMARRREDRYTTAAEFQRDLLALRAPSLPRTVAASEVIRAATPAPPSRSLPVEPPSSVAIPISFVDDSGELLAVDPTDVSSRPPESTVPEGLPAAENAVDRESDGDPTQLMASDKPRSSAKPRRG